MIYYPWTFRYLEDDEIKTIVAKFTDAEIETFKIKYPNVNWIE